jgi:hypothetical protein
MTARTSSRRLLPSLGLLLLVFATSIPYAVAAGPLVEAPATTDLASFSLSVQNGESTTLRGVYVEGVFALPVVQQPDSDAGYVSADAAALTQFRLAAEYGTAGLLAHNDLSGQYFFQLAPGRRVQLVYGDGRIEYFRVTHIHRYRATAPDSIYSDFIDLDSGEYMTAAGLFERAYMGPRHVTFQTCIAADGAFSWGRLFVIAEPEISYKIQQAR